MKTIYILLLSLLFNNVVGQEINKKEIESKVNEVTVFLKNAQILRKKSIVLPKGKTIIKFVKLSPFIDAKSVQVKASGDLIVLSINHQKNYIDKSKKSSEVISLENSLNALDKKINIENTYISIIKDELIFLKENRYIGGKNQSVSVTDLQQASSFYGKKITSLKLKEIERKSTLKELNIKKLEIEEQIKTLSNKKEYPTGEVLVKVDAKMAKSYSFEVSYVVGNASWFPTYDIRAKNINEPINLTYKANVKQDTKVDWLNAKLKFSSADPNISGVAPELKTYYLDYYLSPPTYKKIAFNNVKGRVMDRSGESLPGAVVTVQGTTIGTSTDFDGNYSITIPNNAKNLTYSFMGFETQVSPISSSTINISLKEDAMVLDEVVVIGYGSRNTVQKSLQGKVSGVSVTNSNNKRLKNKTVSTTQVENQTTVDFEIKVPYTVKSDNKNYVVDMEHYNLPALYQYYCVPKIDKDAFLIANIIDWEKYNLLGGEANVFFENTYVGKTLLDVRYVSDTLEISLGRDKKISVNREKVKDFTSKQFMGSKKEETRAYRVTVKNNKNQEINMIVMDQVPVSTVEDIDVNIEDTSGANHNFETGEIKWEFILKPKNKKEFDLKYSVKYPKNKNLTIE